ncbi:MAG: epoxyqueuosine reductase [Verrucomicrobia bacterium]|nr:epoxyqueuosine reductase [Verrucomicrobiota bacterium]
MAQKNVSEELFVELRAIARTRGATSFGVASVEAMLEAGLRCPTPEFERFPSAISVGFRLSDAVIETLIDRPTKLYAYHYRVVNAQLDRIALELTAALQTRGYEALPLPSSQVVDWDTQRGQASHKWVALFAGLGFFGLNNLIVHPEFGARLRYVTVYTDAPLPAARPIEEACGECRACVAACPCGAIGDTVDHFNLDRCCEQLNLFKRTAGVGHHICGLCIKACVGREGPAGKDQGRTT